MKRGKLVSVAAVVLLIIFWWFRMFWPSRFVRFAGFRVFFLVVSVALLVSVISFRWFRFVDLISSTCPNFTDPSLEPKRNRICLNYYPVKPCHLHELKY